MLWTIVGFIGLLVILNKLGTALDNLGRINRKDGYHPPSNEGWFQTYLELKEDQKRWNSLSPEQQEAERDKEWEEWKKRAGWVGSIHDGD